MEYLKRCLPTVFKTDYPKFEVIIVDDGSTDGSMKMINSYRKNTKIIFIQNERNLGLVKSRNKAINKATGDILVFLDNDTEVDKNWLTGLSEVFTDQEVGAAQSKMFDVKNKKLIQQAGMKLIPFTGFGVTIGRGEKEGSKYNLPIEIVSLGAALAVRKEIAKVIGGFDKQLFHYCDDLDFSWRVWIAGFKILLAPNSKVYHHLKVHNPNHMLYFHLCKNSLRMIIKNYELLNVLKFLPASLLFSVVGAINILLIRRSWMGILGVVMGLGWSIANLFNTLAERRLVQKFRKVDDDYLFKKIMVSENIYQLAINYFEGSKKTIKMMRSYG